MIRGLALNLVVFGVLFVLHIVAAANDMDAVFRLVAVGTIRWGRHFNTSFAGRLACVSSL